MNYVNNKYALTEFTSDKIKPIILLYLKNGQKFAKMFVYETTDRLEFIIEPIKFDITVLKSIFDSRHI